MVYVIEVRWQLASRIRMELGSILILLDARSHERQISWNILSYLFEV